MARRKTLNRKRSSIRRSIESGSGFLDPDTNIVDEEQTFWWNHLQENTFAPHSLIYDVNETARQLSVNSRMDSSRSPSEWWRNLKLSDSEHAASTSPRRNLSAAIVKANILQTSETSESERELDLRKKKVRLKANNRKSINNAFSNALDDTEVAKPSKLQKKQANYSDLHDDSNSRKRLQESKEDNNLSPTEKILKSKPGISRRRRHESIEDQNPFQDILTEDGVLNNSRTRKSIARSIEKESSRSMHRNVDVSKDHNDDQRKSMRASQGMPLESVEPESSNLLTPNVENALLESNAKEIVQSSDESDIKILHNKILKLKSRFIQRARKSMGRNAFADVLAVDSSVDSHFSISNPNKENAVRKSPRSSFSPSKRSVNRSKTNITHENSPIRRSSRSSLNAAKKQSLDVPAKDNIEVNSSSSSLDNNEFRKKKSVFFKPKSRILQNLRKSVTNNPYEEILEKDISPEKSNVSTKGNRSSFERDETVTRTSQVRGSLAIEKSSRSKRNKTMSEEDSYDISLKTTPNVEKDVSSENENELSENRDLTNASKSISRKNVIVKAPEKEFSSNRKSAREETLKEHTRINAIGTSTNEIVTHEIINDDARDDTDIEQDLSRFKRVSSPSKEVRLMRNSLRNRSGIPTSANIGVHEVIGDSHNDNANREHDSSVSKRVSKSSPAKEARLTRNSLRNRSETPKLANREIHEVIDNSYNDSNREHDSSMSKRISKSSSAKEARLTRNRSRNRSETPKPANKDVPKRSINWIADIEEDDNISNSEINIDSVSQIISSTRISKVSVNNIGIHKSTILSEIETADDRDADPKMQTIHQRNSTNVETGNKTVNRPSVQRSNRASIKEGRDTASKQKSLSKSQNYRSTPIKASDKDISFKANKLNSSKTVRKIDDFFKVKQASTTMDKQSNERAEKSQIFNTEKMEKIKTELERIKSREMAAMKILVTDKKETELKAKNMKPVMLKQATKKPLANPTRIVNKAFLVDGKVYKPPKLPRPKHWATDRLYKFLWNRMEPKYKLATRLKSEKFMQELAKIVSCIERRKNYKNYKSEMEILMKEMARLKIISTRNDFYHFCQDFLPYEFRVKVVPMLLPGNKMNIPYNPEKLHIPLLDTTD